VLQVIAIAALLGSLILAGVSVFAYFGGYWFQLLSEDSEDVWGED
jgi:hypothetical protein